ncbi:hypothetical protein F5Y19DRAFT_227521 [Xylariaceae sp. FL1651]|nr:hypothetical protein F5Y19DRAFT_227521 [Xylariaceae sp. FL1651]
MTIEGEFGSNHASRVHDIDEAAGKPTTTIAFMNALHPNEVERVATIALSLGPVSLLKECDSILCLTGGIRAKGIEAALARPMAIVCVGHQVCEEWGVWYLAKSLKQKYPSIRVDTILEAENAGF